MELAISLTVILMLLSGAVDFGMAFYSYVALRDAAQEGALYGSLNPNIPMIRTRVQNSSSSPVPLTDGSKVTITPAILGSACQGTINGVPNAVKVTVTYNYPIIMPLLGGILGRQTIPLKATATDTILTPTCGTST